MKKLILLAVAALSLPGLVGAASINVTLAPQAAGAMSYLSSSTKGISCLGTVPSGNGALFPQPCYESVWDYLYKYYIKNKANINDATKNDLVGAANFMYGYANGVLDRVVQS